LADAIICGIDDSKSAKDDSKSAKDDSKSAKAAARVARSLSTKLGLRLVFVRVLEPGSPRKTIGAVAERLERLTATGTSVDSGADCAPCPVVVVPPGADESPADSHDETHGDIEFAGGIARFSLGPSKQTGETEFAGGIARFNLGSGGH
jgi:hypothetical protein